MDIWVTAGIIGAIIVVTGVISFFAPAPESQASAGDDPDGPVTPVPAMDGSMMGVGEDSGDEDADPDADDGDGSGHGLTH